MFRCKVCSEKDHHIDSLQAEVIFLRGMLTPQNYSAYATRIDIEANKILDGAGMPIIEIEALNSERTKAAEAIQREADAMLSGSY